MESLIENVSTIISAQVMVAPCPSIRCQFGRHIILPNIKMKNLCAIHVRGFLQHQGATRTILASMRKWGTFAIVVIDGLSIPVDLTSTKACIAGTECIRVQKMLQVVS